MPDQLPTITPGNWICPPEYSRGQSVNLMGLRYFEYHGFAVVTSTTGTSIDITNENGEALQIPCPLDAIALSAATPAYVTDVSFYIPAVGEVQPWNQKAIVGGVTVSTTNVLKLAAAVGDDLTSTSVVGAVSGAATAGVLPSGIPNGEAISIWNPLSPPTLTAATTLRLFSATAAGAAGVAGGNIRCSAAQGRIIIPVRVGYYRRRRSPSLSDIQIGDTLRATIDLLS